MIKVGIVGGTGYTGVELLRLLALHPEVELHAITSRGEAGTPVSDVYPSLRGHVDLRYVAPDQADLAQCDLVFFATPNGVAMNTVPDLLAKGVRIVDLAADFRLKDPAKWQEWYGVTHACPELLAEAVYGLPEVNREHIRQAKLVANPGCYATAVQLGFLPLLAHELVESSHLIANGASGASGAGRGAAVPTLLSEAGENFKAYKASGHRHLPEIRQGLTKMTMQPVGLTFVPHLIPIVRGIHTTLYAKLRVEDVDLQQIFEEQFANEPFVDVMPAGSHPETKSVRGANGCRIAVHRPQGEDTVVVLAAIDNLVKGAAGQAVQNMNIMLGLDETAGLNHIGLMP